MRSIRFDFNAISTKAMKNLLCHVLLTAGIECNIYYLSVAIDVRDMRAFNSMHEHRGCCTCFVKCAAHLSSMISNSPFPIPVSSLIGLFGDFVNIATRERSRMDSVGVIGTLSASIKTAIRRYVRSYDTKSHSMFSAVPARMQSINEFHAGDKCESWRQQRIKSAVIKNVM